MICLLLLSALYNNHFGEGGGAHLHTILVHLHGLTQFGKPLLLDKTNLLFHRPFWKLMNISFGTN